MFFQNHAYPREMAEWIRRKREIAESAVLIREYQKARAYAFPPSFAPDGRLREASVNHYMQAMNLHYEYNKQSKEDLTLDLMQVTADGTNHKYATVGQVFSADFFWNEEEAIRLHVIAVWRNNMCVTEHYQVFDLGTSGIAVTIPRRAWDNWRMWADDAVEGIHQDKRILFMLLGDRAQIFNITLEHFSQLNVTQVRSLMVHLKPGKMLIRPSIEEAGLDERPAASASPQPPLVNISSSSSSGSDQTSPNPTRRPSEEASCSTTPSSSTGTRSKLFRGTTHKGEPTKGQLHLHFRAKAPKAGPSLRFIHFGPKEALPRTYVDDVGILLQENLALTSAENTEAIWRVEEEARKEYEAKMKEEEVSSTKNEGEELTDDSVTDSFQEETSVEEISSTSDQSRDVSGVFDMTGVSGVSSFSNNTCDHSRLTSTSDWDGPYPMDDSVEVFLAKRVNNSQVVNISTDSSVLEASRGQASDSSSMDL